MVRNASLIGACLFYASCLLSLSGCQEKSSTQSSDVPQTVRLATTTSTVGSGLFSVLIPRFEQKYSYAVEVLALGTGAALQAARDGQADVVLVHARPAEDQFIAEGFGLNRRDVMYNDFVLLGPPADPAGIKSVQTTDQAFLKLSGQQATFISRGDNSGTHMREMSVWNHTGINPTGDWYLQAGSGMLATLRAASRQGTYALADRSTYLHNQAELELSIVLEGDKQLFNPYGIIAVNPAKVQKVNYRGAMAFIDFVTSGEGQRLIGSFGKENFGTTLFTPMVLPH